MQSRPFEDVTERKNAEEALISANRQLNDIIEFLPDATMVIDKDKKVIAWNRAIEEMTGVSKKEMIGKGDHAYTVPFFGDRRPHLLDLIDAPDEELESRYQHVTKKGRHSVLQKLMIPVSMEVKGLMCLRPARLCTTHMETAWEPLNPSATSPNKGRRRKH